MASFTINGGTVFAEGTSVSVYPRTAWGVEGLTGAPSGTAAAGPVTITGGTATFSGLTEGVEYIAYAASPNRYKRFVVPSPPTGSLGQSTTDLLYEPSYPPDVLAPGSVEVAAAAATGGTNRMFGARVVVKRAGTLHDLYCYTGVAGTNVQGAIYDVGATTNAVRTRLWAGSSVAGATAAWVNLGDPALTVTSGQHLDLAVQAADGTTTLGRRAGQTAAVSTLPAGFATVGGCLFKVGWLNTTPVSFALPTTISEAEATNLGAYPVLIARIS